MLKKPPKADAILEKIFSMLVKLYINTTETEGRRTKIKRRRGRKSSFIEHRPDLGSDTPGDRQPSWGVRKDVRVSGHRNFKYGTTTQPN